MAVGAASEARGSRRRKHEYVKRLLMRHDYLHLRRTLLLQLEGQCTKLVEAHQLDWRR